MAIKIVVELCSAVIFLGAFAFNTSIALRNKKPGRIDAKKEL